MSNAKQTAALAALPFVKEGMVLGVGSGSTVDYFIEALIPFKNKLEAVVAASIASEKKLKALGLPLVNLNDVGQVDLYVDGADEINQHMQMIKGGGAAATREKIIASCSKNFVCIAEKRKKVDVLGKFPIAVEVIPMARSFVAREIVKLNGLPEYRIGVVTDNGNVILDCYQMDCTDPLKLEYTLNNIPGVVGNGVFAARTADVWVSED